jgi:hypothetical protein
MLTAAWSAVKGRGMEHYANARMAIALPKYISTKV